MAGTIGVRRRRRATNRNFRLRKPHWVDPFPFIPGTEPEKRIFEALFRRRIYFVFQGDLPEYKDQRKLPTLYVPAFKPDFYLPEYRVIIDPFGIFHHSLPEARQRDAVKSVVYRALGYAFYHPWWDERGFLWQTGEGGATRFDRIGFNANEVLDRIVELKRAPLPLRDPEDIKAKRYPGYRIGKNIGAGANSVALANAKRKRPKKLGVSVRGRRRIRRRV